ncbi:branched-chain amino acid transport system permease protein LivH [Desulfocucumis palustris]|uniref:Branched-chain amino acid transport system permease protein LivH n=1 Tax=Desulfocucumis palustris TaxID=1898651 RepID=A0A2L2XDT6_9FIRM|nr:branched-chain amino acid ABC transporter permease [Desulfocucumis palustris]GBF34302.1 branched-chain amino acid transport system permease protein LivH [Desulfocucumis palustris]
MQFSELLQYLLTGLTLGGIYALIALGFVTIYNVTGHINFTQGEFVMLGALITASLVKGGTGLWLAVAAAILLVGLFGALFERAVIYPARNSSVVTIIIITIGFSVAIRGGALLVWGTQSYPLPSFSSGESLQILGAALNTQSIWVLALSLLVVAALFVFFERTALGMALKACAINRLAARLMGISPQRMSLLCFTLSAMLGALAGIVITPITTATYDMGLMLGLKGFVAAVLGGLTSTTGAVVGGFLLGVLEALGAGLISSGYKDAISFLILLLVLLKKPSGLLGKPESKRV